MPYNTYWLYLTLRLLHILARCKPRRQTLYVDTSTSFEKVLLLCIARLRPQIKRIITTQIRSFYRIILQSNQLFHNVIFRPIHVRRIFQKFRYFHFNQFSFLFLQLYSSALFVYRCPTPYKGTFFCRLVRFLRKFFHFCRIFFKFPQILPAKQLSLCPAFDT